MDRFGPRMSRGNNFVADQIDKDVGGKPIDPRFLEDKVVSYMAIGGSEWTTDVQPSFNVHALTPIMKES
jgi:hypothetical protein